MSIQWEQLVYDLSCSAIPSGHSIFLCPSEQNEDPQKSVGLLTVTSCDQSRSCGTKSTIPNPERKYPAAQLRKIQPGNHQMISSAFPNSLLAKWFLQTQHGSYYKRCLKVRLWQKVNRLEALFQKKNGCMKEDARILLEKKKEAGVAARMLHWTQVKGKLRKAWALHALFSREKPDRL